MIDQPESTQELVESLYQQMKNHEDNDYSSPEAETQFEGRSAKEIARDEVLVNLGSAIATILISVNNPNVTPEGLGATYAITNFVARTLAEGDSPYSTLQRRLLVSGAEGALVGFLRANPNFLSSAGSAEAEVVKNVAESTSSTPNIGDAIQEVGPYALVIAGQAAAEYGAIKSYQYLREMVRGINIAESVKNLVSSGVTKAELAASTAVVDFFDKISDKVDDLRTRNFNQRTAIENERKYKKQTSGQISPRSADSGDLRDVYGG